MLRLCFLLLVYCCSAANLTIVTPVKFYYSNPPTWLTSPFFRAGNKAVISVLTGKSSTPTFTFTFSSPLTALPYLAYGIKNYRGNDYYGEQYYEIKKVGLTAGTFTVAIQIYGWTNLWLLNVAYMAVEPSFPHHFNTFDNVPLNYTSGALVNISSKSTVTKYFVEYINYTKQAIATSHKTFPSPLSSNVIVLFMTSLWIVGTKYPTQYWPVKFHIATAIVNSSHYLMNATLSPKNMITNVHFSQIIFNSDDIVSSQKYNVVYGKWYNDVNGGFLPIPIEFVDNFIMGVTAFESQKAECGFEYQWEYANDTSGTFGVKMLYSINIPNTCGFSWSQSSLVYIQTWLCLAPYNYYNVTSGMCQTNCGGYYRANTSSLTCEPCNNTLCYQCDDPDVNVCTDCDLTLNYVLVNGTCTCPVDSYPTSGGCMSCEMMNPGCINCTYTQPDPTLPFDATFFTCLDCNQTVNYFLSGTTCQPCLIDFCIQCANLTACLVCQSNKTLTTINTCDDCFPIGCDICNAGNQSSCFLCSSGYHINASSTLCYTICGDGYLISPEICDDGNLINGDGCSGGCLIEIYYNCTTSSPSVCSPICGDGYIIAPQICDDGNTHNGDGCNSNCQIQVYHTCTGVPSICTADCGNGILASNQGCDDGNFIDGDGCNSYCQLQISLHFSQVNKVLSFCNKLSFTFFFSQHIPYMQGLDYSTVIIFYHPNLYSPSYSYSMGILTVDWLYSANMQNQIVNVAVNASVMLNEVQIHPSDSLVKIHILPHNNVAASYSDVQSCGAMLSVEKLYTFVEIFSYILLILSALPAKIVGLELFGVLQLAFISLGSIDQINVMMAPMMSMKGVNGLSLPFVHSNTAVPSRVKGIDYSANFLDNCNVMFVLLFCEIFIAFILYVIAKILKQACPTLFKVSLRLLKEVFLTLILFNCFNVAYSTAIHFKYGEDVHPGSTMAAVLTTLVIFLMGLAIIFVGEDGFGEFKEKFGDDPVQRNYFTVTIIYRMSLGLVLGSGNEEDLSTLWALGISLLFVMYNLINLPFRKAYHNYRACLCHLTQFVTLFVAMFYRSMKSTSLPQSVAYIFSPAKLQLALIVICVFISAIVLSYDIYLFIKECCTKKQQKKKNEEPLQRQKRGSNNTNFSQKDQKKSEINETLENIVPEELILEYD